MTVTLENITRLVDGIPAIRTAKNVRKRLRLIIEDFLSTEGLLTKPVERVAPRLFARVNLTAKASRGSSRGIKRIKPPLFPVLPSRVSRTRHNWR